MNWKNTQMKPVKNVKEYIRALNPGQRIVAEKMREVILKVAPRAEELMSYQMPAYKLNGILVYFGVFQKHLGFYPTASCITYFKEELSKYKNAKGSVQFSLDKPLPIALIKKMVKFRIEENMQKRTINN